MITKLVKIIAVLVVAVIIAGAAAWIFMPQSEWWKPRLEQALSEAAGRKVKLAGAVTANVSLTDGFVLQVNDVSIANPPYSSRPLMATMGRLDLGLRLPPLLRGRFEIISFSLDNADIRLESDVGGRGNWQFDNTATPSASVDTATTEQSKKNNFKVTCDKITITNSRIGLRDQSGQITEMTVEKLSMPMTATALKLYLKGLIGDNPLTLELTGGSYQRITDTNWPFILKLEYANRYAIDTAGILKDSGKFITLERYELSAGDTKVSGKLDVDLRRKVPLINGTVQSKLVKISDLSLPDFTTEKSTAITAAPASKQLFSDKRLDVSFLKTANAKLDIRIAEISDFTTPITDFYTIVDLKDGHLTLHPLKAKTADNAVVAQLKINTNTSPTSVSLIARTLGIDLPKLLGVWGAESVFRGLANLELDIVGRGNNLHAMAANSNGRVRIIMNGGSFSNEVLGSILGHASNAMIPGLDLNKLLAGDMNCLAVQMAITDGKGKVSGLADAAHMRAIVGGEVNLENEKPDVNVNVRSKFASATENLLPSIRIRGTLTDPAISLATSPMGIMETAKSLLKGQLSQGSNAIEPLPIVTGVNPCVAALDSPTARTNTTSSTIESQIAPLLKDGNQAVSKGLEMLKNWGSKF